uniref:Ubiquitin carboxyl-terminal hydrolase 1-like n=3 Tax=Hirondellea gigas TaxID=1518452 RepID=A0A6A7FXT9_9CRUS
MTALDNTSINNSSKSSTGASMSGPNRASAGGGGGRLSLRGQKRTLSSDISPAPEPRTSHRIRTNSSSDSANDSKGGGGTSRAKGSSTMPSSSPAYRAAQLGLRRQPASNSSGSSTGSAVTPAGGGVEVGIAGGRVPGVCPLANLGNTCFLNSVLYALRFLPGFTHDLHHLHTHLQAARCEVDESLQQRIQFLSELHAVFVQLSKEEKSITEARRIPALQPFLFLQALRVVNPMFEGNRQQDAHELLHCLLDQLCHLPQDLVKRGDQQPPLVPAAPPRDLLTLSPAHKRARRRSERIQAQEEDHSKAVDVVGSKFVGRMCLETCCSECEKVTGREETFLEVCVPVKTKADFDDEEPPSECEVFMSALCEEECLQGNNKYWCDACSHHNEARRSVHYPQLPHHLLIHVKRFSAYSRHMYTSKCSDAMPAPLQLSCFCRSCIGVQLLQQQQLLDRTANPYQRLAEGKSSKARASSNKSSSSSSSVNGEQNTEVQEHQPYYLSAMVCHLGASLSSGHYMTYVRVSPQVSSSCPEPNMQQQHNSSNGNTSTTAAAASDSLNCQAVGSSSNSSSQVSTVVANSGTNSSSSSNTINGLECNWLECCALRLELVLPQLAGASLTNGCVADMESKTNHSKSGSKSSSHENTKSNSRGGNSKGSTNSKGSKNSNNIQCSLGMWLECDDEKIKLVAATEVVDRMRGTSITPYLLFYSRRAHHNT